MSKNLVVVFCSLRPEQLSSEINQARELDYFICLSQLLRVVPDNFDIVFCDNTVNDANGISLPQLKSTFLSRDHLFLNQNIGTVNKGMGELHMLKACSNAVSFSTYDKVSYCTGRKIFTCPYVFERTNTMKKSALISNPDFAFLTGKFHKTEKNRMFNDMFFSLESSLMQKYADWSYSKIAENIQNHVGSEQNLYTFITSNNIEYEWLDWLGVVRNDWGVTNVPFHLENFHVC